MLFVYFHLLGARSHNHHRQNRHNRHRHNHCEHCFDYVWWCDSGGRHLMTMLRCTGTTSAQCFCDLQSPRWLCWTGVAFLLRDIDASATYKVCTLFDSSTGCFLLNMLYCVLSLNHWGHFHFYCRHILISDLCATYLSIRLCSHTCDLYVLVYALWWVVLKFSVQFVWLCR